VRNIIEINTLLHTFGACMTNRKLSSLPYQAGLFINGPLVLWGAKIDSYFIYYQQIIVFRSKPCISH
jgi:hypothetical protein